VTAQALIYPVLLLLVGGFVLLTVPRDNLRLLLPYGAVLGGLLEYLEGLITGGLGITAFHNVGLIQAGSNPLTLLHRLDLHRGLFPPLLAPLQRTPGLPVFAGLGSSGHRFQPGGEGGRPVQLRGVVLPHSHAAAVCRPLCPQGVGGQTLRFAQLGGVHKLWGGGRNPISPWRSLEVKLVTSSWGGTDEKVLRTSGYPCTTYGGLCRFCPKQQRAGSSGLGSVL